MSERGEMTAREMGRLGGAAVKAKYGTEHFRECGRKGGTATAKRHGPEFYSEIGRKGGGRLAELARLGREAEAAGK